MALTALHGTDLVISSGQQGSNIFTRELLASVGALLIFGPATLPELVVVQVAWEKKAVGNYVDADFFDYQGEPGQDVQIGQGKAVRLAPVPNAQAMRLFADPAVAADRTFKLWRMEHDPWLR